MSWGAVIGAAGAIGGGLLSSQGGGGGSSTPKWLKPYMQDVLSDAKGLSNTQQQYFPGQTTIGELPSEQAAWAARLGYDQNMFGPGGLFGTAASAAGNALHGDTYGGQMTGALSPYSTSGLMNSFNQGPGSVGRYSFNTQLDPTGLGPTFGQAGGLDATGALRSALSGTPDYSGAQGAIDAANAPILRQLNQEIIPGLNQRATFLNNGTGGIKTLNKVLPEVGQRMSENALGVMEGERQRALQAQQNAAGLVSQGGLQSFGLGLQNASSQADLQRMLAGLNLSTDTANAGLQSQFREDLLGLGNLSAGLAGAQDINAARWGSLFPQLAEAGQMPSQDALAYSNFQRQLAEGALGGDIARWNFNQQEPYNRQQWYANIVQGIAGVTPQAQPQGSSALGALGGATAGMGLAGSIYDLFRKQPAQTTGNAYSPWSGGTGAI